MVETYTVQNAMKSGKTSPTYGEEYYVKFVESEATFPLWFKTDPTGTKIDGSIEGAEFVKVKKDYKPNAATNVTKKEWTPMKKNNSDGMRQGMCINNAATYVSDHSTAIVDPETWAKTVFSYANALYLLGDLGEVEAEAPPAPAEETPETAGELFGAKGKSVGSK